MSDSEKRTSRVLIKEVALWSLGIICYILLSGSYPYTTSEFDTLEDLRYRITYKNFDKDIETNPDLIHTTDECKAFLKSILQFESKDRPTAEELLQSSWATKIFDNGSFKVGAS